MSWVSLVSYEPPIAMFAGKVEGDTWKNALQERWFALARMPLEEYQTVHNCAEKLPRNESEREKYRVKMMDVLGGRVPENCVAYMSCRFMYRAQVGDHVVVFGLVIEAKTRADSLDEGILHVGAKMYGKLGECRNSERF